MATISMDSIQFYQPHSSNRAVGNKSALHIKSQPTGAKSAPRRMEREIAPTQTSTFKANREDVVGEERNSRGYDFDIDDNNEFPSLEELLRSPLRIKNSLEKRASQPFHQRDCSSCNARQLSLASGIGNSKEIPLVIDDDESQDEDENDDDNIANDQDDNIANNDDDNTANDDDHSMANDEDDNTADDDRNIANDDNIADDDHRNIADDDGDNIDGDDAATTTNGSESAISEQHPHLDDKQIDKPEQSSDGNDDQDDNGQDNDMQSHNNEGSQPAKRRQLDPASDCNYKRRIQPTRGCRLKDVPWPERAYTLLDNSQHKRPSSVRSSN